MSNVEYNHIIMKRTRQYSSPETIESGVVLEQGFAQSGEKWYDRAGSGDFDYTIDNDNRWE